MTTPIRYHVDLTDRLQHLVRVRLLVPADLADGARIVMPIWTPGSYVRRDYIHHVQWIRARDAAGNPQTLSREGTSAWRLPRTPAAGGSASGTGDIEVELELYANDLSVRTNHVDDHHALLVAAATFPLVDGAEHRPHLVHLPPTPDTHQVFSLLPPADEPDTYRAEDVHHLVDSAFEVGALPTLELSVGDVPHQVVWAGHHRTTILPQLAEDATAIFTQARKLFGGELPVSRYTLLVTGWDRGGGGLEHRDGAVLQIPGRVFQSDDVYRRFLTLVSHEYLHLWNVKRLVPAALVRPRYDQPVHTESLWVAEGWTAYYDELLCARAGTMRLRTYLDTLRDAWQQVRDTPGVALQPLRQASYDAWTKHYIRDENSPNAGTDYYTHGALVAWYLDLLLRAADPGSDGLDDVLRLLWQRHAGSPAGYTEEDVTNALTELGGAALGEAVERHVAGTDLPPIADVVGAVGLTVEPDANLSLVPTLGVRLRESDAEVVLATVLRDGPAWQAGLTGGDRLVAIDGLTVARGELSSALLAYRPGHEVEVTVTRGPRLLTRPVVLGEPKPRVRFAAVDSPTIAQRTAFQRWTRQDLTTLR